MMTEKLTNKDGYVAVLYTPSYGCGWYSSNPEHGREMIFDKRIAEAVNAKQYKLAAKIAEESYPGCCTAGAENLQITWIRPGMVIEITEFDGYETVEEVGFNPLIV